MQIPPVLKSLVRKIMRAFYEPIDIVVADVLVRETCVKQDDIASLLQLDEQQVGSHASMHMCVLDARVSSCITTCVHVCVYACVYICVNLLVSLCVYVYWCMICVCPCVHVCECECINLCV